MSLCHLGQRYDLLEDVLRTPHHVGWISMRKIDILKVKFLKKLIYFIFMYSIRLLCIFIVI
jgi:hypothetical protein